MEHNMNNYAWQQCFLFVPPAGGTKVESRPDRMIGICPELGLWLPDILSIIIAAAQNRGLYRLLTLPVGWGFIPSAFFPHPFTRRSTLSSHKKPGWFSETTKTIIAAVMIAIAVRTVAFEPFNIPSKSMEPTLLVGDYLFVSKYSYGYSHFSLPLSPPLFSGRIFGRLPQRGDVAVFKLPRDPSQ